MSKLIYKNCLENIIDVFIKIAQEQEERQEYPINKERYKGQIEAYETIKSILDAVNGKDE